jgi:hypothetical protein
MLRNFFVLPSAPPPMTIVPVAPQWFVVAAAASVRQ